MRTPLLSFLLLLTYSLTAQSINPDRTRVIATDGLPLRSGPSDRSDCLKDFPYNTIVEILSPAGRRDTIGEAVHYDYATNDFRPQPVTGHWARVTDGVDTGYVFDAYLWYDHHAPGQPQAGTLTDVREPRGVTLRDPADRRWFGVYETADGEAAELRPLSISYVVGDHGGFAAPYIVYKDTEGLRYLTSE